MATAVGGFGPRLNPRVSRQRSTRIETVVKRPMRTSSQPLNPTQFRATLAFSGPNFRGRARACMCANDHRRSELCWHNPPAHRSDRGRECRPPPAGIQAPSVRRICQKKPMVVRARAIATRPSSARKGQCRPDWVGLSVESLFSSVA